MRKGVLCDRRPLRQLCAEGPSKHPSRLYSRALEYRVEQASQKISGSREDVEKFLLKDDKRKKDYYRKFAGGVWNDATNYDLCLNSSKLGFEKCVDLLRLSLRSCWINKNDRNSTVCFLGKTDGIFLRFFFI